MSSIQVRDNHEGFLSSTSGIARLLSDDFDKKRFSCSRLVGYKSGEQHLGKPKVSSHEESVSPQAGLGGQPDSHVSGQGGPEIMGGKSWMTIRIDYFERFRILIGSASTRVLGQSVDEQLKKPLSSDSGK